MPLRYYDILLHEEVEDCGLSFLLSLTNLKLKKILESRGLIAINNNIVKFVINTSGYGDNYSWRVFILKNTLFKNYFFKNILAGYYNKYQNNMYFIGLGINRDTKMDPSTQF